MCYKNTTAVCKVQLFSSHSHREYEYACTYTQNARTHAAVIIRIRMARRQRRVSILCHLHMDMDYMANGRAVHWGHLATPKQPNTRTCMLKQANANGLFCFCFRIQSLSSRLLIFISLLFSCSDLNEGKGSAVVFWCFLFLIANVHLPLAACSCHLPFKPTGI
jgi:hypothetical protein